MTVHDKTTVLDDFTEIEFKTRQRLFIEELNSLQDKYSVRMEIKTVAEQLDDTAIVVKAQIHAVPAY